MDKLKLVRPSKENYNDLVDFINEFRTYGSAIEGVNGLHRNLDHYKEWLNRINYERTQPITNKTVPMETYLIVRESDNKIVGMTNVRLALNERFRNFGGNIGLCIRPTERKKGYAKTATLLIFEELKQKGIDEIILDCDEKNTASRKTIESLGGQLVNSTYIDDLETTKLDFKINIEQTLEIEHEKLEYIRQDPYWQNLIINLFYKEIIPEASTGRLNCFFTMNIPFTTVIDNKQVTDESRINTSELLVPRLKITNVKLFNELLIQYITRALVFYRSELDDLISTENLEFQYEYLHEQNPNSLVGVGGLKNKYQVKFLIGYLFANASFMDFDNPIKFLEDRIAMFDNRILEDDNIKSTGHLDSIGATLYFQEKVSSIHAETPTKIISKLIFDDGYIMLMPDIYIGKTNENYILYAILDKNSKKSHFNSAEEEELNAELKKNHQKQIRKGLHSKINGAPEHYFIVAMLLSAICKDKELLVNPILIERWNAKIKAIATIITRKNIEAMKNGTEPCDSSLILEEQQRLQTSITDGIMRYFTKMRDSGDGINITCAPFEIDDKMHVLIDGNFTSKSTVFNEINESLKQSKEDIISLN